MADASEEQKRLKKVEMDDDERDDAEGRSVQEQELWMLRVQNEQAVGSCCLRALLSGRWGDMTWAACPLHATTAGGLEAAGGRRAWDWDWVR